MNNATYPADPRLMTFLFRCCVTLFIVGTGVSCASPAEPGGPGSTAILGADMEPVGGTPVANPASSPLDGSLGMGSPPAKPDAGQNENPLPTAEPDSGIERPVEQLDAGLPPLEMDAGEPIVDDEVCPLPRTYRWTSGAPLAQPKNGSVALKDFTHVYYKGQHIIYMTTNNGNWGSAMFMFDDWARAGSAEQIRTGFGVAPTLFYFAPKDVWVLAYQWGRYKFSYRTSSDPTDPNSWGAEKSLYNTALPPNGTGPIDQTVICDSERCYLYYAGDNGHIYKSSMPIGDFPGEFRGAQDSGIPGTTQNLFEGVQVYSIKGSDQYLMLVEAQSGTGRYFRAWTAGNLDGPWTLLTDEFARKSNVTFSSSWTNDISHGDLIRSNPDETMPIDPCDLQMLYQGRDPNINTSYGRLPYRPGLLTLQP